MKYMYEILVLLKWFSMFKCCRKFESIKCLYKKPDTEIQHGPSHILLSPQKACEGILQLKCITMIHFKVKLPKSKYDKK